MEASISLLVDASPVIDRPCSGTGARAKRASDGVCATIAGADYAASAGRIEVPFNTPLVLYLVSEQCRSTHGIYSANSGRYAKVRIAAAEGWVAPMGSTPPAPEDIAAHWEGICDGTRWHEPLTVYEEFTAVAAAARRQGRI